MREQGQVGLAWCRRAEAVRKFRLDRILDVTVLDVPASFPAEAEAADVDAGLFQPSESDVPGRA
jgi:predicted DNA-binding transcriptional regulator YafY